MYYKIDVFSNIKNAEKESYLYKDNDPKLDCDVLKLIVKKLLINPYGVRVTMVRHKQHRKIWDWSELAEKLRTLKFYEFKTHEVEDYCSFATFYGEKPFDIETEFFNGEWYSFCKKPSYTCKNIFITLLDCGIEPYRVFYSKYLDPYVRSAKLSFSNDGFGHWHLNKLIGTHTEYIKEELYS